MQSARTSRSVSTFRVAKARGPPIHACRPLLPTPTAAAGWSRAPWSHRALPRNRRISGSRHRLIRLRIGARRVFAHLQEQLHLRCLASQPRIRAAAPSCSAEASAGMSRDRLARMSIAGYCCACAWYARGRSAHPTVSGFPRHRIAFLLALQKQGVKRRNRARSSLQPAPEDAAVPRTRRAGIRGAWRLATWRARSHAALGHSASPSP